MLKASCTLSAYVLVILAATAIFIPQHSRSQPPPDVVYNYVKTYSAQAVHQMLEFRIPASVILAQAILESRSGTSELARRSNNHFGIKCHKEWFGDTVVKHDDMLNECFRKYLSIEDSYRDHSAFLTSRARYAHLFELSPTDYAGWCRGLKEAGYATYYAYAEELIQLIEGAQLYRFDAAERMPPLQIATNQPELMSSWYAAKYNTLRDFTFSGYLWQDEMDIVVQSLDLIVIDRSEGAGFLVRN